MRRFLKILLIILNIVVAATMLIAAYGGHVNPLTTSIPGIMLMMFPGFLLASVLILVIDLIFSRRLMFIQGFAILFCAPAIWNICPLNFFSYSLRDGERQLKVMTYNVYNMYDFSAGNPGGATHGSLAAIIDSRADIVILQEALPTDPSMWTQFGSSIDTIVGLYPHRVLTGTMAVWSKYPLSKIDVPQPDSQSSKIFVADVDVDGFPLTVYNVHLQSLGLSDHEKELYYNLTRGEALGLENSDASTRGLLSKLSVAMKLRAEHALMLRGYIDSLARPNVIVAGDFNDIADCWAQRTIMGRDLHNTFTQVGFGPTISYNANRFYFNIDHMLYGGDLRPLKMDWGRQRSSDHYSVTSTYAIPKPATP